MPEEGERVKRKAATAACALAALLVLGALAAAYFPRWTQPAMSAEELQSLAGAWRMSIADGGPADALHDADGPQKTAREVSAWLAGAKSYRGFVRQTDIWTQWRLRAYKEQMETPELFVSEPGGATLSVQPAYYRSIDRGVYTVHAIPDFLTLTRNGKTSYIRCAPLYDWLENGGWKAEFQAD